MSVPVADQASREAPPTTPTAARWALVRRARLPAALLGLLTVTAVLLALTSARTSTADLDPTGVSQGGSRALARLLAERGIAVRQAPRLAEPAVSAPASTVLVPSSSRVGTGDLRRLTALAQRVDVVVVVDAVGDLRALAGGDRRVRLRAGIDSEHEPGCGLPAAVAAGRARTGRASLDLPDVLGPSGLVVADRCYRGGGDATLVRLRPASGATAGGDAGGDVGGDAGAGAGGGGSLTLLTGPDILRNDRLAEQGNAALALGLLDHGRPVLWLLPTLGQAVDDTGGATPLTRLLPRRLLFAAGELLVGVLLLALWRGRRLGPVVTEPLPVVVRSVETVAGRARLYRGARARDRATLALREAARAAAARRLGLGAETTPAVLVQAVADQTGRAPAEVAELLYRAPAPADDVGLVRVAAALDDLRAALRPSREAHQP